MQLVTNIPSLFTVRCNRCNNEFFREFVESSTPNAIAANYDVPASGEVTPERAVGCVFRPEPLLLARNNLGSRQFPGGIPPLWTSRRTRLARHPGGRVGARVHIPSDLSDVATFYPARKW
jgi:hypothetical protein